ncbi:MarR family transcriptional regulator [soil metagenome]
MPRLDATRLAAWRGMQSTAAEIERRIDADLREEWDLTLGWFDVLASLQRLGGSARPSELAADLRLVRSSLTRRLDRLEEDGWVERHEGRTHDGRTVTVELTRRGRALWREMNVTYRRSVQRHFAGHLDDESVATLHAVLDAVLEDVVPPLTD